MARIYPVVPHKVFGGGASAAVKGIAQFGSKQTGTPDYSTNIATIQALAAWLQGWAGAVVQGQVPPLEELNAAFLEPSYQIASLFECGIPDWNSGITYSQYSFCQLNGVVYISQTNANLNNNPASSPTNWNVLPQGSYYGGTATGFPYTLTVSNLPANLNPASLPVGTLLTFNTGGFSGAAEITIAINSGTATQVEGINADFLQIAQDISVIWDGTNWQFIASQLSNAKQIFGPVTGAGTANAQTFSYPSGSYAQLSSNNPGSNFSGLLYKPGITNTGATTLNSIAVKTYAGVALSGGELTIGNIYLIIFDGISWRIMQ